MKLIVVKRFVRTSVSEVKVVFRRQREWENMYVVSSPEYFNTLQPCQYSFFSMRQYVVLLALCWNLALPVLG